MQHLTLAPISALEELTFIMLDLTYVFDKKITGA